MSLKDFVITLIGIAALTAILTAPMVLAENLGLLGFGIGFVLLFSVVAYLARRP